VSGFLAILLEMSPIKDYFDSLEGPAGIIGYEVLFVALIEESVKFAVFLFLLRIRDPLREPFDAVVAGATVGLGFAVMENAVYGLFIDPYLTLLRSFLTIQGHMLFSALPSLGLALSRMDRELREQRGRTGLVIFAFSVSILLHGLRNFFLEMGMDLALDGLIDVGLLIALALFVNRTGDNSPYRTWPWQEWRRALAMIAKGLDVDPDNPNLLFRQGLYNLAGGRWVDACVAFDGVVETGKRRDLARSYYAAALSACGEREASEDLFGEHWPNLSQREQKMFTRSLERAILSRTVLRAEIRDITRKAAWLPRRRVTAEARVKVAAVSDADKDRKYSLIKY
jgi:tetratricopeptide (TPR) repeat protein